MPATTSNVEILRKGYDDYDDGDLDAVWRIIHPELFVDHRGAFFEPHTFRGIEAYQEHLDRIAAEYDEFELTDREFWAAGDDRVVMCAKLRTVRDGTERRTTPGWIWTFKDGLLIHCIGFRDANEAKHEAGIA